MYEVRVEIGGSRQEYWAHLRFEDRKGTIHRKEFRKTREADRNSNLLQAAIEALKILQVPCQVELFTDSDYLTGSIRQRWLAKWETNGWRNAEGNRIKNAGQWQEFSLAAAWHTITIRKTGGI